jgi:hypothetical protein
MQALGTAGFQDRAWSGFASEYDLFSFVQSWLNRCGLKHNLLYNFLRRGHAKVIVGEGVPRWQLLATLLLAVPLGLAAVPVTLLAGLAKQGGTLTVLAHKLPDSAVDRAGDAF